MKPSIPASIKELLNRTKPAEQFLMQVLLSNLWLFNGAVINELEKTKETNAMVHTTLVPTIVKAGIKDNVIPSVAKATFNSRILPGESSDDVLNFVIKAINDDRVSVKKQTISLMEPSPVTPFDHPSFKKIESIIGRIVPNVIVTPYLMLGASDARYYRSFSEAVLNFSAVQDTKGFHGIDERIGKSDLNRMVGFYRMLVMEKW